MDNRKNHKYLYSNKFKQFIKHWSSLRPCNEAKDYLPRNSTKHIFRIWISLHRNHQSIQNATHIKIDNWTSNVGRTLPEMLYNQHWPKLLSLRELDSQNPLQPTAVQGPKLMVASKSNNQAFKLQRPSQTPVGNKPFHMLHHTKIKLRNNDPCWG